MRNVPGVCVEKQAHIATKWLPSDRRWTGRQPYANLTPHGCQYRDCTPKYRETTGSSPAVRATFSERAPTLGQPADSCRGRSRQYRIPTGSRRTVAVTGSPQDRQALC